MKDDYSNYTTDQLEAMLVGIATAAEDEVLRACAVLVELRGRGVWHPMMRSSLFRWFVEIHEGRLHPRFVMTFCGWAQAIRAVCGESLARQLEWANGADLDIAEVRDGYKVARTRKPLARFAASDLKRAFGPEGLRPVHEQEYWLLQSLKPRREEKPAPKLAMVQMDADLLIVDGQRISPAQLRQALIAAGLLVNVAADALAGGPVAQDSAMLETEGAK